MQTDSLISILTALLLASLLIATGYLLLNRALQYWDKYPLSLRLSASYFIGIAQFLSIYRTASYMTEMPQLSAYAAIGLSIYFVVLLNRTLYQVIFEICRVSSIYTLILTFFVLGIFLFLFCNLSFVAAIIIFSFFKFLKFKISLDSTIPKVSNAMPTLPQFNSSSTKSTISPLYSVQSQYA